MLFGTIAFVRRNSRVARSILSDFANLLNLNTLVVLKQ